MYTPKRPLFFSTVKQICTMAKGLPLPVKFAHILSTYNKLSEYIGKLAQWHWAIVGLADLEEGVLD